MGERFDKKLLETLSMAADAIYAQPEVKRPHDEYLMAEMFVEDGGFEPHTAVKLLLDPKAVRLCSSRLDFGASGALTHK